MPIYRGDYLLGSQKFYNLIKNNMNSSKIIEIVSVKPYLKWAHWPIYYFTMKLENSDTVNIWKKTEDAFQLGDVLNYVVEVEEYGVKKVRHPKPDEMQQSTTTTTATHTTPIRSSSQNASFALSYSKDLCVAGKIEFQDLTNTADVLLDWLNSK